MYEKILVVDDEPNIVDIIRFNLEKESFQVITAADGVEAIELFTSEKPDLIILDVMMPRMDGYEVCRRIRSDSNTPIILVTARSEEFDTVLGLEMGADEYVTKPFSVRELMARVRTLLRRYSALTRMQEAPKKPEEADGFLLDAERCCAVCNGKQVELTHRETEILQMLLVKKGQIIPREELLRDIWGLDTSGDERTVDVTIRRLREKIEKDASTPEFVLTKRGIGYYFSNKV